MNIVITGAGRGIGFECIKQFASEGHTIIAISRNINAIESLNNPNIFALQADITHAENMQAIANAVATRFGTIDILINNAGILINKPFTEYSIDDAHRIFEVNFFSPALLIQNLLPYLQSGSHVVNIGSMGGYMGSVKFPGLAYYSASKAALANLTECLAEELKDTGIRINCLALGSVQTEMLA
jgi:NAD(P)-dependent dehydrogenase (short-subunit alcohol dehydrogenase family)